MKHCPGSWGSLGHRLGWPRFLSRIGDFQPMERLGILPATVRSGAAGSRNKAKSSREIQAAKPLGAGS
jgi:hypothetical protein